MTVGDFFYYLLLMPLQLIFEVVYDYAYRFVGHPGLAIVALSLVINLLVLPLYRRADAMQEAQRNMEAKLHDGVAHIRKVFRGDERTMMLQTYYRQNHYNPVSALRGAISLFLEIPFFIAAYNFLSGLELLNGVSFGPIADLSKPDALIVIGGLSINLLPILMTVINAISSAIFTKGYPLKTKIQLYAMAAFFLVFLYDSPSGLVFYWTLNNAFSLAKTIFYKIKNRKFVLSALLCVIGVGIIGYTAFHKASYSFKWLLVLMAAGIILCLPLVIYILKKKSKICFREIKQSPDHRLFFFGALFLAILTGAVIPSAVINASPQEFMNVYHFVHPLWYVVRSLLIALGMFVLWMGVFYWLATPKAKVLFGWGVWIAGGISIVNYLFFGTDLGNLASNLQYDNGILFSSKQKLVNLIIISCVAVVLFIFVVNKGKWAKNIVMISTLALCCMSIINAVGIHTSVAAVDLDQATSDQEISFTLSKNKKNVIVIMLDRAMGAYIPYMMNEKPELKEKFDGFTYYANTVSFGGHTNFATPALFGGYEYTPVELNRRSSETLAEKHNEALKVLPVLFDNSGYNVTVCDLPYAGYQETPDLSIFDEYPDIKTYITKGAFTSEILQDLLVENRNRNFFCYSILKISPIFIQGSLYESGGYHQPSSNYAGSQIKYSQSVAYSINSYYYDSFAVLENMSAMTMTSENCDGAFLLLQNDSTHSSILFQEPNYELTISVDNTNYDIENQSRFNLNGRILRVESAEEYGTYETNMAVLIRIGEWLDYLRENDVYDNTRIILVSDHGFALNQLPELIIDETALNDLNIDERYGDAEFYYPLLMVKDFDSTVFSVSDEFMTNADVATLATEGIIANPTNPFTGKDINSNEKEAHDQYIIASGEYTISTNNGNQFHAARWYSVHDSIWEKSNWMLIAEDAILP